MKKIIVVLLSITAFTILYASNNTDIDNSASMLTVQKSYEAHSALISRPMQTLITWDFETGHQGWNHTNGQTFPIAWDVLSSGYKPTWTPPSAGDSTYWIDSDAAGSGVLVQDTALSPEIIPDSLATNWLKWGVGYNWISSGEWLEIGIKYYDGATWTVVPLVTYTTDTGPMWDSADVSAYNMYELLQIYVYYDDNNIWAWCAAFDNVSMYGTMPNYFHDVGVIAVNVLSYVNPYQTISPSVTYGNFGDTTETFEAGIMIDSSGINIYNEYCILTLDSGADTTIEFAAWTSGPAGNTYYGMAYTYLAIDENPLNDTMSFQIFVTLGYWQILAPIPVATSGHSESTINDGTYMVSGFHPSGQYPNTIYHYDITTDTWTLGNNNPYGCGAYGMAYGAAGKHYRFGGTDGWPVALDRVDIYDPDSGWSAGTPMPISNIDMIGGVYKDSLIFMFGGGNWGGNVVPHTGVYFYDIYEDTWTQATSFPGQGRGCLAGGVVGDDYTGNYFAVVACGYDGTMNYLNDYIVGSIDPVDPANITWSSPTTIPGGFEGRYRVASNVWLCGWPIANELIVTCGQGITTPQLDDLWSYDPISDTWFNWNMPKNFPVGNVNSIAITNSSIYVVGGYTGSYVDYHECISFGAIEEMMQQLISHSVFGFAANIENPMSGHSGITYTTTKPGKVTVKVYDGAGRLVKTLVDRGQEPSGTKTVFWNAKDDESRTVANGIYFVRLEAEGKVDTYKMVLVK